MKRISLPLIKYLMGFSLAFLAVSNCFDGQSSSSDSTPFPAAASRLEAAKPDPHDASFVASATANHDGRFGSSRGGAALARPALAHNAFIVPSVASPFAPTITATKSHTPAGSANPGDTLTYTVVITNSGTDATGVNFSDTIDPNTTLVGGSVIASPIAVDDSYHTIGNVNISVPAAQGVIANDSNPNGGGTLTVTKVNATVVPGVGSATASTANGSVTMSSDGSFTYTPAVAFRGPSDSFTYTLDNGTGKIDTATVTINVSGLIWFIDSAAATNGDGRLNSPFNCLVGTSCFDPAAADAANDNIFVYSGSYTGGLTLLNGQKLIGQGASASLLAITGLTAPSGTNLLPATGGANPTISTTAAATNGVNLGSGNELWGLTFGNTTGFGISGSAVGSLKVRDTTINNGSGPALNLTTSGTLDAVFQNISSTNSTDATPPVNLASQGGNLSVSGSTTVTNPSGIGIQVQTAAAGATLNFGNTTVSSSGGTGVSLLNTTGAVSFGQLNISPDANQRGLLATDNAGTITTAGGAITTSGAIAVEITRSIGTTPLVVSLTSVTASGGTNGIKLTNTSGSFTVSGDGASDPANTTRGRTTAKQGGGTLTLGSGGTISGTSGAGVLINNATNVTLRNMTIQNNGSGINTGFDGVNVSNSTSLTLDNTRITGHGGNFGLHGTTLSGLTIQHCEVDNNATTAGTEGPDVWNVRFDNLSGTASVLNSLFHDSRENIFAVKNTGATVLSATVTNSEFRDTTQVSPGNDGLHFEAANTANISANVSNSTFLRNRSGGFFYAGNDSSGGGTLTLTNNSFEQTQGTEIAIAHQGLNNAVHFSIHNNLIRQQAVAVANTGTAVAIGVGGASNAGTLLEGTFAGNQIGNAAFANSGSTLGQGVGLQASGAGTLTATIDSNTVRQVKQDDAMFIISSSHVSPGRINVSISNNDMSVNTAGGLGLAGLELTAGVTPTDSGTICANIANNNIAFIGDPFYFGILAQTFSGTPSIELQGYGGAQDDTTAIQNFLDTRAATVSPSSFAFVGAGHIKAATSSCSTPSTLSLEPDVSAQSAGQSDGASVNDDSATPDHRNLLRATFGEAPKDNSVAKLSPAELNWMVQSALERWRQSGITAEDLARLQRLSFDVANLPGDQLATVGGQHITIDETAANYGWYYDQTPQDDGEYDLPVPGRERQTTEMSAAHGKMDLLTVVMRELGEVYLQGKKRTPKQMRALMETTLSPSVRRMPVFNLPERPMIGAGTDQGFGDTAFGSIASQPKTDTSASTLQVRSAAFNPTAELMPGLYGGSAKRMLYAANARRAAYSPAPSGETVNLNIGTIPAGESVTIMFQVTINSPFPNGVCSVTNVGHVTGSNFSPVDTNSDVTNINKPVTIGACPANIVQNTDAGVCTAVVTFTTPTADGCPVPTVTCSPASGSAFAKGVTTVTCTASNGNPPDATCTFTVTVKDTEAPVCHLPANITQNNDAGQCTAVVTYTATATDNCGSATITCNPASGFAFPKGTTTVNCTASDDSPDSPDTNCSFTVTVKDTEAPTCNLPANITTNNTPNQCTAVVTYTATASDNCPGATISCSPSSGFAFPLGTTTVNCTASDTSPDSPDTHCSFTVTVKDTQAPTLSPCPANISVTSSGGCQVVTYPTPTATDNCGSATVICSPSSGSCFPAGTTTVTCTASDTSPDSPNTSCSFTVTVVPCAITCPSNITVGNDPGQCGAVVNYAPSTNGGCGTIICTPAPGSFFPVGTTTVVCTTQAGPGCSFTVHVNDTQGPTITVTTQPIEMWPPTHKYHTFNISDLVASATDNCSGNLINSVVIASVSSDEPENGGGDGNTDDDIIIAANCKSVQLRAERQGGGNGRVYTIVFRVKDAAGNVSTASRTVTVPANQGGGGAILGPGPGYTVTGTCP